MITSEMSFERDFRLLQGKMRYQHIGVHFSVGIRQGVQGFFENKA